MLVMAKCIAPAWDNRTTQAYVPGQVYEIDSESDLASLTVIPVAYNAEGKAVRYVRDGEGKLKEIPIPKPAYVFEFDRNANPNDKPHDYTCKQCGKDCKTLNGLGSHTRSAHKDDAEPPEKPEDDEPKEAIVKDGRGKKKGKTFKCKRCPEALPNLYAYRMHLKTHEEAAVTQAA